jgi:chemotaxis protein MotB
VTGVQTCALPICITKALEEQFGKSLLVTQHQDRLVLTMLGQVLFESGEAELTPLGLEIMKQVGHVLASLPNKNIQVEGHTDNNPINGQLQNKFPTNWELSTARATTVLRFLIEETGMAPTYFSASGYADIRPVTSNDTEDGRAQNRRVEIVLFPQRVGQEDNTVATLSR